MSSYRVISQSSLSPEASFRRARSSADNGAIATIVEAPSLLVAAARFAAAHVNDEQPPRLVSVEELVIPNVEALSDDAIGFALTFSPAPFDPHSYEDELIFSDTQFDSIVEGVAAALRECGILPGLTLSIHRSENYDFDHCMVEIIDSATGTYRSVGRDPRDLILDRTLVGYDGIISVARALLNTVSSEHLL